MSDLFLERDAVISDCSKYRYLLRRTWDPRRQRALFIMLNPSTADANIDDPTIRSCMRLCRDWAYGSLEVVNLFAWRSTDPDALADIQDPVGPDNGGIIQNAIARCDTVICAWGKHPIAPRQAPAMLQLVTSLRPMAFCFGTNKDGSPKHPLYIKSGTPLQAYRLRAAA